MSNVRLRDRNESQENARRFFEESLEDKSNEESQIRNQNA